MRRIAGINTPSKRWAKRNGACLAGLRRLGRQSIYHYFMTGWHMSDMVWVARRLKPLNPEHLSAYLHAIDRRGGWVRGSFSNVLLCRVALRRIVDAFEVQWPSEIL